MILSWSTSPQITNTGNKKIEPRGHSQVVRAKRHSRPLPGNSPTQSTPGHRRSKRHRHEEESASPINDAATQRNEAFATEDHAVKVRSKSDQRPSSPASSRPVQEQKTGRSDDSKARGPNGPEKHDDFKADLKFFLNKWKDKIDDKGDLESLYNAGAEDAPRAPERLPMRHDNHHSNQSETRAPAPRTTPVGNSESRASSHNIEDASVSGISNSPSRDVNMCGALDMDRITGASAADVSPRSQHLPSRGFISQIGQQPSFAFASLHYADSRLLTASTPLYERQLRQPQDIHPMQGGALLPELWHESRGGERDMTGKSSKMRGAKGLRPPERFDPSPMRFAPGMHGVQPKEQPLRPLSIIPQATAEPAPRSLELHPMSDQPGPCHHPPPNRHTTSELEFLQVSLAGSDVDTPTLAAARAPDEVENRFLFAAGGRDGPNGAERSAQTGRGKGDEQALADFWQPNFRY